ncbi:MAG: glycosyltransferase family 2 protein [Henriciella sp.]
MNKEVTYCESIKLIILTFNEIDNIETILKNASFFDDVVVVDSHSNDGTVEYLKKSDPNIRVYSKAFDSHANQWNFALSDTGKNPEWILALDADYQLSEELVAEIATLVDGSPDVYSAKFKYQIYDEVLSGSLYPPVNIFFRAQNASYEQDGHTQRLVTKSEPTFLKSFVVHNDQKPLERWLQAQLKYARLEAQSLVNGKRANTLSKKIRRNIWIAPILVPLFVLIWKRCLFDGPSGWAYALQRMLVEILIALFVFDLKHKNRDL